MQGNRQMHSLPRLGFLKKMNITLVFYRSPLKYSLSSYQFSNESVDLNLKPSYSENLLPLYLLDSRLFPLLIHSVLDFKINRPKHLKDQSWYFSRLLKSVLWLCRCSHSKGGGAATAHRNRGALPASQILDNWVRYKYKTPSLPSGRPRGQHSGAEATDNVKDCNGS